jgi:hypothetical protein
VLVAGYDEPEKKSMTDLAAGQGDAPATADDAATEGGTSNPDDAYAVSFLQKAGPSDGTPGGKPPEGALPEPLAVLDRDRSTSEIDAAEAEILRALGGTT